MLITRQRYYFLREYGKSLPIMTHVKEPSDGNKSEDQEIYENDI